MVVTSEEPVLAVAVSQNNRRRSAAASKTLGQRHVHCIRRSHWLSKEFSFGLAAIEITSSHKPSPIFKTSLIPLDSSQERSILRTAMLFPQGITSRKRYTAPPNNRSGLKGVLYFPRCTKKPWKAYIRKNGWYLCIGYFPTKEQAAEAYNREAKKHYGRGCYLNTCKQPR